ncbi:MAG: hypothetical protein CVU56_00485 [Deltaproteobacteria bacterium HGW-Deltaproteobacteria-14]|jgi:hypothetical protein|nr:MAG: hypothetical protein CVU56_00485 [Deltaproteobacteria bacterium HGW-Deltaproteobacteria-14]
MDSIEILGFVASAIVAVSLTMSSLARLRALNLLGSTLFAAYGWLVSAYPVLAVNSFIAVVNVVYLVKMKPGRSQAFELLAIHRPDNRYLRRFLDFHAADIARFIPGFSLDSVAHPHLVFILRDMLPVGLVVAEPGAGGDLDIHLDYVIPAYRDFRCAQYFYNAWSTVIPGAHPRRFVTRGSTPAHRGYLIKVGFTPAPDEGDDVFTRPATAPAPTP